MFAFDLQLNMNIEDRVKRMQMQVVFELSVSCVASSIELALR